MRRARHRNRGGIDAREPSYSKDVGEVVTSLNRQNKVGSTLLLASGLLVVGIFLGIAQTNARKTGGTSFADTTIRLILSPVSSSVRAIQSSTGNLGTGIFRASTLIRENQILRSQLSELALYTEQSNRLVKEVDALRSQIQLAPTYDRKKVFAEVEGYFPSENRLTLNVGSNKGIKAGQPVVSNEGLVGIIQTTSPFDSQVRLLNSVGPSLGALAISHTPPIAGVLRGDTPFPSVIFSDPGAPVQMSDLITTSGFSTKIPRGIPIGKIIQVVDSPETGSRKAMINLAVNVSNLREVFVLL